MTLQQLASLIAKREGKKSQVKIGDVREVLRLICDIDVELSLQGKTGSIDALYLHALALKTKKAKKLKKK